MTIILSVHTTDDTYLCDLTKFLSHNYLFKATLVSHIFMAIISQTTGAALRKIKLFFAVVVKGQEYVSSKF